jgi:hypothetical protein
MSLARLKSHRGSEPPAARKSPRGLRFYLLLAAWFVPLAIATAIGGWRYSLFYKLGGAISACPLGHETIRAVPVLYGLLRGGPELDEQLRRHDVIAAGCGIPQNPPAYFGYCDTCGYEYDPGERSWIKRAGERSEFIQPFQWSIADFPFPPDTSIEYYQISGRAGVSYQAANCTDASGTEREFNAFRAKVERFLDDHGTSFTTEVFPSDLPHNSSNITYHEWTEAGRECKIRLSDDPPESGWRISITVSADPPAIADRSFIEDRLTEWGLAYQPAH